MPQYICSKCYYTGKPRYKKRGSAKTELVMWAMFPLGVPYTIWRMFGKATQCKECRYDILIELDTPLGARLLKASEDEIMGKIAGVKTARHAHTPEPITSISAPKITPIVDESTTDEQKISSPPENPKLRAQQDPNQW